MVREIMTDAQITLADQVASKRKKTGHVRYTRPWSDAPAAPVDAPAHVPDNGPAVEHLTRQWDGPASPEQFIIARPRADRYVYVLIRNLRLLDGPTGDTALEWYEKNRESLTTAQGSEWINRLKAKIASYNGQALAPVTTPIPARTFDNYDDIPSANYALPAGTDNRTKTHFYRVSRSKPDANGRVWIRVKERASDDLYPVTGGWTAKARILDAIRAYGPEKSGRLFSDRLGRCRNCFKSLTDEDNGYKIYGYGPDCGPECMGDLTL